MEEIQGLRWCVSQEAGFQSLKQQGKIYQSCVRPVLLYCCETWKLIVLDKARLHGVER